MFMGRIIVTAF